MTSDSLSRIPADFTVYQIFFRLSRAAPIDVGRFGRCRFEGGWYFYTGSARRAIGSRIRRHLARAKKPHWHIDWLLSHRAARVTFVLVYRANAAGGECAVHRRTLATLEASTPVRGFGSSDCRGGCPSHLGRLPRALSPDEILKLSGWEDPESAVQVILPPKSRPRADDS